LKIADGMVEKIVQKTIDLGIKDESQFIILSDTDLMMFHPLLH